MSEAGKTRIFNGKKYKWVGSRSNKERALALKARLTRLGTISVRLLKVQPNVVGLAHYYNIYARPEKSLTWERLEHACRTLE